jgi:hypothetical protein
VDSYSWCLEVNFPCVRVRVCFNFMEAARGPKVFMWQVLALKCVNPISVQLISLPVHEVGKMTAARK